MYARLDKSLFLMKWPRRCVTSTKTKTSKTGTKKMLRWFPCLLIHSRPKWRARQLKVISKIFIRTFTAWYQQNSKKLWAAFTRLRVALSTLWTLLTNQRWNKCNPTQLATISKINITDLRVQAIIRIRWSEKTPYPSCCNSQHSNNTTLNSAKLDREVAYLPRNCSTQINFQFKSNL